VPFGDYKDFTDCVAKNKSKDNPDAFCGWLKKKIEGADELVAFYMHNPSVISKLYALDEAKQLSSDGIMRLLTKQHAQAVLSNPSILKKDQDATVIDDHRWVHMWANTIRDGNELFITKEQLRKLHDIYIDEFMRRKLNHQSAIKFEVYQLMGDQLKEVLAQRQPFQIDASFIAYIGSSLSDKQNPRDLDILVKSTKHPEYREAYLNSMPEELREGQSVLFEPHGPSGPYINGYELWALPTKDTSIKEPKYQIQPMSPIPPPKASPLNEEDLSRLEEDSYYAIMPRGIRLMIHRNRGEVIAYDEKLEEYDLPEAINDAVLNIEDPPTFILDGFLTQQGDWLIKYQMIDMPWWRDSEHINQAAEIRRHFMNKLSMNAVIEFAPTKYFTCKADAISFLQQEKGPYLLIPGSSNYPINGITPWMLYTSEGLHLGESSDEKIKDLVNSGKWESMGADARFNLMTKRNEVEPLYPYAQLKTTKKGYSAREVFGLKSVKDLAEEIFKVPSRQSTEVKIDGFRVQVHKSGERVKLFTESGHDITKQLPAIVKDIQSLPAESFVLDAEATPYDKDFSNLGRAGAAPAFAMGAKGPVDDSMWGIHVFDILYLDGEQLHNLTYQGRRQSLRGLELPIKEYPKSVSDFKLHLWENTVHWVTSASAMEKMAEEVSKVPGSEGAMFKDADSKYRLNGNTPLWCLTGGSRIFTEKGLIPIKDVRIKDRILTGTGEWAEVEAISTRQAIAGEDTIYDIVSSYGIKERMTGLHRVKVLRNNNAEWIPIEDVAVGEKLLFPVPKLNAPLPTSLKGNHLTLRTFDNYTKEIPLNTAFWGMIGFWVGDGSGAYNRGNTITGEIRFGISPEADISDYLVFIKEYLGVHVSFTKDEKRGVVHYYFTDKPLAKWLCENFRGKDNQKTIPLWFKELTVESFNAFMDGYFRADGTKGEKYRKRIACSSNQLVNNLILVNLIRGTPYGLEYNKPKNGKGAFRFTQIKRNIEKYGEYYLFTLLKKTKARRRYEDWTLYDIQVSNGESFTGPYLTMHNSKMKATYEVDAIVVGVNRDGNTFNYVGAVGPVDAEAESEVPVDNPKGRKFVKYKGKVYSILGKSFNTKIEAKVGDIIRVTVKDARKINDQVYHWFHPQVLEKREDKVTPDPLKTIETIAETAAKQQKLAYLVGARYGLESPLACCLSPWIAVPGDNWIYLQHNNAAYDKLKEMGVTTLVGTNTEREIMDSWMELGLDFSVGKALTISELLSKPLYLNDLELPSEVDINVAELKGFYADNRSSPIDHMTVSCCDALVPLTRPLYLEDVYLIYPNEEANWKYVIQFHVRGLSVHADFRAQIDDKRLIGWTWSVGKSLLRPMMRRLNDKVLNQVGVTRKQIEDLTISELSQKVRSTKEGKALIKQLSAKTQVLSQSQLKSLADEVWKDEFQPILDNPNNKIITQRKSPEPLEWLTYEGEVPAGAVGATRELEGQFIIMDKGEAQFGAQKSYFHEYWLNGGRIKNRRIIIRRLVTRPKWEMKEAFAWMSFFTKPDEAPYTISSRAVTKKWMPPEGISALPKAIRGEIPAEYKYWTKKEPMVIRDDLVKALKKKDVTVKLSGLKFSIKRVWHKGPEVRRGIPVVRNWLLLHDGSKVLDAWDFGRDSDPIQDIGITARRRKDGAFSDLLPESGEIPANHPASYTEKLPNNFDTSDEGSAQITADTDDMLQLRLNGKTLKGTYVFVREDPGSEMWTFAKADISEEKKGMMLASMECTTGYCKTTGIMHLSTDEFTRNRSGNLLFINGPAIKPGEVIPMDGKPAFFTKEGIEKFWPSMLRQPIIILHGELKGDVIGYVDKIHYDSATGWGWIDRGVIWHPMGIKMILDGTLPAFSIEVMPEVIWDPEHQHEHVTGGSCVGVAVVPVGACKTCNIVSAEFSQMKIEAGKVYKFGMTAGEYIQDQYWNGCKSTQEISSLMGIPRSTIENWMNNLNIPRRDYVEARHLRGVKEQTLKLGGRVFLTALGTGNSVKSSAEGKDNRNIACTLLSLGINHLLINAPKGINAMLGLVQVTPKHILLEHGDASAIGGLHELRALKPNVFATDDVWTSLRMNYKSLSGEKGSFEDLYDFPRYVIKDKAFILGNGGFVVGPMKISSPLKATAFKINAGGVNIWYSSSISMNPGKALEDIHVYIGDGSSEKGHASIKDQIYWASKASVRQIFFTKISESYSHEELSDSLREMAPNAQPLFDGAKVGLSPGSTAALLPNKVVQALVSGEQIILVRTKPYTELAKQTILFGDENNLAGLYIEGFPEGPHSAEKVKQMKSQHLLSDKEWKQLVGDAENVWIYHPRALKVFDEAREYMADNSNKVGPYIHDVALIN